MYSEWASVQQEIQTDTANVSVLHNFPDVVGKEVANSVVKSLAQNLSLSAANNEEPSHLSTPSAVKWTMQVLCYGLNLPLSELETIKDCVNVYCEWFSALTAPHVCVPRPVIDDPNPYVRDMLHHLYNLFVPRPPEAASAAVPVTTSKVPPSSQQAANIGLDIVNRQTILCHRVLRMIQSTVTESVVMTQDTWNDLLKFLLAVNDTLLAPPIVKDGLGDQLCERILSVLFELWALACSRFFPSPPMWKTFREMCCNWRHQPPLVAQWHRFNLTFTARMLRLMYGQDYPQLQVSLEDQQLIPDTMDDDCIVQCWFRFLHIIGDPSDLSQPKVISNTPKFLHMALTSDSVIDPHQHRCLQALPEIFHQAMRGLSVLVDAFLGICQPGVEVTFYAIDVGSTGVTPPVQRRFKAMSQPAAKGVTKMAAMPTSVRPSSSADTISVGSSHSQLSLDDRLPYAPGRPHVNSILHLFGQWLVEAALVGVRVHGKVEKVLSRSRTASFHLERDPVCHPSHSDSTSTGTVSTDAGDATLLSSSYDAGRAEACGALCRIFCSHRTGEEILALYLSRFYIVLHHGLQTDKGLSEQVLASVLFHSCDLLRLDLDGVQILVPQLLRALDLILNDTHSRMHYEEQISAVELRKASIHLLLSMLCLPLHFHTLPIRSLFADSLEEEVTFLSLKSRIVELLLQALLTESDAPNTQMLLGGLMLCVEDLAVHEATELAAQETIDSTEDSEDQPQRRPHTDHPPDSAYEVFGRATSLVCNRLMASWKIEMNVALAAIEVLSGLAKVKLTAPNILMCKRTVNWICEFIMYQCSRPAPAHSKDLHSMICAAFQCLVLWLTEHDYLMQDKQCLQAVLEVVELGISGTRSQPPQSQFVDDPAEVHRYPVASSKHKHEKETRLSHGDDAVASSQQNRASEVPKLKGEKELKPVSMRVKDAAEQLLTAIMDSVGSFPPPCGPESLCSLLDEEALLRHCHCSDTDDDTDTGDASPHLSLRYFVLDGLILVGLLEQSLTVGRDSLPTVTALIRGPFGRYVWNMQLRHLPREQKCTSSAALVPATRPEPVDDVGVHYNIKHRYFPETVDSIPSFRVDKSVPSLEKTLLDHSDELTKLRSFIADQVQFEKRVSERVLDQYANAPFPNPATECHPPSVCLDFQTARLYLSHFSWLSLEALKEVPNSSVLPSLLMLQTDRPEFLADLQQLDTVASRTSETVHVFYVKSGQKLPLEILSNVTSRKSVHPKFLAFVKSLGWPVDVKKHAGWTGHVMTSGRIQPTQGDDEVYPADTGGSLYDGRQQVLYYADVTSEIAFVVPSLHSNETTSRRASAEPTATIGGLERDREDRPPAMGRLSENQPLKHKSMSLDFEKPPPERMTREGSTSQARRFGRLSTTAGWSETKILVVWLEKYEDHETFPTSELLGSTSTGLRPSGANMMRHTLQPSIYIIFIHALQNGLYRIHTRGPMGKMSLAIPLVDGMVVSHRALGSMVRQTASNTFRRKRLDNEGYQPPHARRKIKIKEIVDKYRNKLIEPEFYTALFQGSARKAAGSVVSQ